MKDQTILELCGMVIIGVMMVTAMVIDGDIGEAVVAAGSAALGAAVAHVYHMSKETEKNETEVPQ